MIGSGFFPIVMFTLNSLSAFLFFFIAVIFFTRRVLNLFFSLFLIDAGIVTLAFSFDYEFIQALRGDGESVLVFNLVSFCLLVMVPLYYLSVRKFARKPFIVRDIPLSLYAVFVIFFSLAAGWPPADLALRWMRWALNLSLLVLLCAFALRILTPRILMPRGKEGEDTASYESKTLSLIGMLLLVMSVASSFVDLVDPRSDIKLVSLTMSLSLFVFLVYVLFRSPELLRNSRAKYSGSFLDKDAAMELFAQADRLIREEGLFRKFAFSLSDLAERMEVNARYLSQGINQTTGKNFNRFINDYRLEEARRMLRETDENATDIGFSVGFNSLSSFYDQFKKAEGLSPDQYRKKKERHSFRNPETGIPETRIQ